MPDLIGHPGVYIGVQEWPYEERGRLDPRFRGGDGILRSLCRCPGFWTPACAGVTNQQSGLSRRRCLDPRLRGGDDPRQCGKECNVFGPLRLRGGDDPATLLQGVQRLWTPTCVGVTLTPDCCSVCQPSRTIYIGLAANVIESVAKILCVRPWRPLHKFRTSSSLCQGGN